MKTTDPIVRVEEVLNADLNLVWSVITDVKHMQKWFFDNIPDFKPEVGFETNFMVHTDERSFDHRWKITQVEHNRKISYNWNYKGYPGDSYVHFELFPEEDKTRLRLTTEIVANFPQDIPEFKIESCVGGWNYFIKQSLPKYIDSLTS